MPAPLYVTQTELKNAVTIPDNSQDDDITRALGAASRAVDKFTARRFWLDSSDSTHKYTAISGSLVYVDDLTSITSVSSNGILLDSSTYFPEPANNPTIFEPYLWIESNGSFSTGRQEIEIVGKFGWPEIPESVKQIVIITAVKALKRTREAPWGIIQQHGLDGLALRIVREDPDILYLIEPLVRAPVRRS